MTNICTPSLAKRISSLVALSLFATSIALAQRVSQNFNNVPMPEALRALAQQSDAYTINFIYDDLEDFRVTTAVKNKPIPDAIQQVIGFYPIRVTTNKKTRTISVESTQKAAIRYQGTILGPDNRPLAYANIALLNPQDHTFITGGVSNESGIFVIPCKRHKVVAKISYVGLKTTYHTFTQEKVGKINMQEDSVRLKTVEVKGQIPIVKTKNGIISYNMPLLLAQLPADNAFDALTRIPGVYNNQGIINFGGRGATLVINGKPSTQSNEQIIERLKNLPAAQLATAEVMMSAPARYHARGLIINVVTKDFLGTNQFSGQFQTTWLQSKYGLGKGKGNVLYSHGKLCCDVQYAISVGKTYGKAQHIAEHPLEGNRVHYEDQVENKTDLLKHDYRIGVDYAFDEKHRLGAAYNGTWQSNDGINTTTGTGPATQHSDIHYHIHQLDVNYSLPFGLQLNASYMNYRNPRSQILDSEMDQEQRDLVTSSKQNISKWIFTADQLHSLGNGWGISYGVKVQLSDNNSYQITMNKEGVQLPDATSHVDYTERIMSPYTGFSKQFNNSFSVDASATVEQYHTPRWNEWRVYPAWNVMWNASQDNMLNLAFNSNAVYPNYWSTMSSIYYSSAYSEIWGNPELRPSSNYELNLMWQLKQRYTFVAFAQFSPNFSVQLPYQPSDRMAVIMKEVNFDYRNTFGLQASMHFSAGNALNGNISAVGLYVADKSSHFYDIPFNRKKLTFILNGTASCLISPKANLRLVVNPFYQHDAIQGVFDIGRMLALDVSVRWSSKNGKWSAILSGDNLTNRHFSTSSMQGNQHFVMKVWQNYPSVSLTILYQIGNYKARKHREVDTSRMGY